MSVSTSSLHPELTRPTTDLVGGKSALLRLLEALKSERRALTQGLRGAARGYVLSRVSEQLAAPLICVAADEDQADHLAADLAFFLGGAGSLLKPQVLRLPSDEVLPYDDLSPEPTVTTERLGALFHLRQGSGFSALVLSLRALHRKVLPPALLNQLSELLGLGQEFDRDSLVRKLSEMGYQSSPLVEDVGTFSIRGGILDVFSPLYSRPARIEFFGDAIESIRAFDPDTQRTVEPLQELYLTPIRELLFNEATQRAAEAAVRAAAERVTTPTSRVRERLDQIRQGIPAFGMEPLLPGFFEGGLSTVFDYLPFWSKEPIVYWDDPVALERAGGELWTELARTFEGAEARGDLTLPPTQHYLSLEEVREHLQRYRTIQGGGLTLADASRAPVHFSFGGTQDLRQAILAHHGEEGALSPLVNRLSQWRDERVGAAIACGSMGQVDRLKRLLLDRNVMVRVHPEPLKDPQALYDPSIYAHLFSGEVSQGFVDAADGFAVVSDEEIFGVRARRRARQKRADLPFAATFRELKEGDLIVHTDFGIGRYAGLTKMQVQGVAGDFLVLEYAGRDKVYLPVSRMRLIQKFTGGDPSQVTLDKLGSGSWEKTKKRVKENLLKMAAELLQIYAARKAHPGYSFKPPDEYFHQFEADFEFEETPDQAKAIEEVLDDMAKPEPMDRLVCGDVGYGKTEVAMRAAFKATLDHKQVAVLVPTTVLALQHFNTFVERLKPYPVRVELLSRFRSEKEQKQVLEDLALGKVDIVIGTHRLLQKDVVFFNLGLLIIDEEQRFGVVHKERLKQMRNEIDVLTLTATPIPRTLHMSLVNVRDMSVIREAILREIDRGGQIFFVHNRVKGIQVIAQKLQRLIPEARIAVGHGQMAEDQLERVMMDFSSGEYDVLVSTTIIENGLDIPNANTIIVNNSAYFGLAQLYQLRGRVGRATQQAYAYFFYSKDAKLTPVQEKRLRVIFEATELGAGFRIAMKDLEIRGAGNLLGAEQSGFMNSVGFD